MLVLTRKLNQVIIVHDPNSPDPPIEITVTDIRLDSVRLGIAAPAHVTVDRAEVAAQKAEFAAHQLPPRTSTV